MIKRDDSMVKNYENQRLNKNSKSFCSPPLSWWFSNPVGYENRKFSNPVGYENQRFSNPVGLEKSEIFDSYFRNLSDRERAVFEGGIKFILSKPLSLAGFKEVERINQISY
jgi:hypothetical protein